MRDHGGHDHGLSRDADRRYLVLAMGLLLVFMVGEVVAALVSGSLALLSDAAHMLTDVGAIGAALFAMRLAARPARDAWTYGWHRAEILAAAGNGLTLLVLAAVIGFEAVSRLVNPPQVEGGVVLGVALAGVVVNLAAAWLLARANRRSLNIEGAYQHILTDLYAFVGTVIAGIVILVTGWTRADAVASLFVAALMVRAGIRLVREANHVLLEAAPPHADLTEIRTQLLAIEHVESVHDLHVWTLTSDAEAVSAHVVVRQDCFNDGHAPQVLDRVQAVLVGQFDIHHSTFQLEPVGHADHEDPAHH